jgi:predicted cytidylate kinase
VIITIGGDAGSGKGTVGRIVAKNLGYKYISIGDVRREMAKKRGLTLAEFNRLGETEDFTDTEVDEYQRRLGEEKDNLVVDGRTSFFFIPKSVKVFLKADLSARAMRVMKQQENERGARNNETFKDLDDAKRILSERDKCDDRRYKKIYGFDYTDERNYDLVVDSTKINARQVADRIMDFLKKKGVKSAKKK